MMAAPVSPPRGDVPSPSDEPKLDVLTCIYIWSVLVQYMNITLVIYACITLEQISLR